jgi:hypothetical protein
MAMSSYQKQKQKYEKIISELQSDVLTLVKKDNMMKEIEVRAKWNMRLNMEKCFFYGNL